MKIIALALCLGIFPALGMASEAIGYYSDGSLRKGIQMANESEVFLKLFPQRKRGYATNVLLDVADQMARYHLGRHPDSERIQFGDFSKSGGGFLAGHASHQNGLDVDVAYLRVDRREQDPHHDVGFDEDFVIDRRLTPNFDFDRNWDVLEFLVGTGQVNRIFVDEVIKKEYCNYFSQTGQLEEKSATLRRLRPWPSHRDHFHLRLVCPSKHLNCRPQVEPLPGAGCSDAELKMLDPFDQV